MSGFRVPSEHTSIVALIDLHLNLPLPFSINSIHIVWSNMIELIFKDDGSNKPSQFLRMMELKPSQLSLS